VDLDQLEVVDVRTEFGMIDKPWSPVTLASLNGQAVKIAKFENEFLWHKHDQEDEMFYVVHGEIDIQTRDEDGNENTLTIGSGQFTVIPAGLLHKPEAKNEAWVMLFEPESTQQKGD